MKNDALNQVINEIFSNTSILNDTPLFKADVLDEKFDELASMINATEELNTMYEGFTLHDVRNIYLNALNEIEISTLKGEVQKVEYGQANVLSNSARDRLGKTLKGLICQKYCITLIINNYIGTFDLDDQSLNGVSFSHDEGNKVLKISVVTRGYFNFNEQNDNSSLEFSAVKSAISILKIIFTYLSFFKKSIWTGDSFNIDQELIFSIEDDEKKQIKKIQTYKDDVILILFHCHIQDQYRKFDKENILPNFISLIGKHKHLHLAFDWFSRSLEMNDNDNKIIMLCIAFEALYGKHNNTKDQLKNKDTYILKAIYFLSETNKEREKFSTDLYGLFQERNAIIHAEHKKKSDAKHSDLFHRNKNIFIKTFLKELIIHEDLLQTDEGNSS